MRDVNEWFDALVMDSSHKDWLSPRRYYSAARYGWRGKAKRAEFGRISVRCLRRAAANCGPDAWDVYA